MRPEPLASAASGPLLLGLGWEPPAGVGALMTTRVAAGPGGPRFNVGLATGDDLAAVAADRRAVAASAGVPVVWLRQVHGARVVRVGPGDAADGAVAHEADAAWTDAPGLACAVQVADCLPVLFAAPDGRAVAAAHAGWRGLAAGVLESTVAALAEGAGCEPRALRAWLGPCIGPRRFEVGAEVLAAFGASASAPGRWFRPRARSDGSPRWLADLPALARARLAALGITDAGGGAWCTVEEAGRFHSHRRDGAASGRMVAAIWRQPGR